MQPYSHRKDYAISCKCQHCKRHKRKGWAREIAKNARKAARKQAREDAVGQLDECEDYKYYPFLGPSDECYCDRSTCPECSYYWDYYKNAM